MKPISNIEVKKLRPKKYTSQEYLKKLFNKGSNKVCKYKCLNCCIEKYSFKITKRRYCGSKCCYDHRINNWRPHNKGKNKLIIDCATCGGKVQTYKGRGTRFCSRLCFEIDRKNNWSFPHKGKKLEEWLFNGDVLKVKNYREKLKKKMKQYYKDNPNTQKFRKGKTLIQIYGKEKAKEIKENIKKGNEKQWRKNREYMLQTPNRFKKGDVPYNKGKKMSKESIIKFKQTNEKKFLKEVGINV